MLWVMRSPSKMCEARFNTPEHKIFDHHVVCLAGDGCLQEGISQEASALAAHLGLDNLILFYDSNNVTLDAMAPLTQSEDTAARYEAYGWDVHKIDGHDLREILNVFEKAKAATTGKPQFIVAKTLIGKGIPEVSGTNKAHGEAGVKFVEASRKAIGLPDETFFVSAETRSYFSKHKERLKGTYEKWESAYKAWRDSNGDLASELDAALGGATPDLLSVIPKFDPAANIATRKAGSDVLQPIAQAMPLLISGSADLHGSTLNYINEGGDFNSKNREGRNLRFGIREHAMCGILNGIAYDAHFPGQRRDISDLQRLWSSRHSPRRTFEIAGCLHLHARLRGCGRGWTHARTCRNGRSASGDTQSRCNPSSRSRGNGRCVRSGLSKE